MPQTRFEQNTCRPGERRIAEAQPHARTDETDGNGEKMEKLPRNQKDTWSRTRPCRSASGT